MSAALLVPLYFILVTLFPQTAVVHILHSDQVRIYHADCQRLDDWTDVCYIPSGEQAAKLLVTAPCAMTEIELFTSASWGRTRINDRLVLPNTAEDCHNLYLPLLPNGPPVR